MAYTELQDMIGYEYICDAFKPILLNVEVLHDLMHWLIGLKFPRQLPQPALFSLTQLVHGMVLWSLAAYLSDFAQPYVPGNCFALPCPLLGSILLTYLHPSLIN